jgi:dCTP diphosphatase
MPLDINKSELEKITHRILRFNIERDWAKFHNPKDLAISMSLEAAEVLEHFQWKNEAEIKQHLRVNKNDVANEIADVAYWALLMCEYFNIDLIEALKRKMDENEAKYPIEKAKGSHKKYTELN